LPWKSDQSWPGKHGETDSDQKRRDSGDLNSRKK
jgi:hypothetical protein